MNRAHLVAPALLLASLSAFAADESLAPIVVTGIAPLADRRIDEALVPRTLERWDAATLQRLQAFDVTQFLNREATSVFLNEVQGNPLQPDLQFRGFTASPLLGLPQGLAVYQDGVRINEPFGDTVNWALLPDMAIAQLGLSAGGNPVFGANALGGAISLVTRNGFTHPGLEAEISAGAFGRREGEATVGGTLGDSVGWLLGASYFEEDGWRDHSPSDRTQLFGDGRWRGGRTELGLTVTYVTTDLVGNGLSPIELLAQQREAIFTRPDRTENELLMLSSSASWKLGDDVSLRAVAYVRSSDIDTLNGDDSPFEECEDDDDLLCDADGDELVDESDDPIPAAPELSGATVNRTGTDQEARGLTLQLSAGRKVFGRPNELVIGAGVDDGDVSFESSTELGALDETRQAIGAGVFVEDAFTGLRSDTSVRSVFFSDTLALTERLAVTLAGRYDDTQVTLRDQLGDGLDGDHDFGRFNPFGGVTFRVTGGLGLYASLGESSRAPSPAELTCADEDDPCRLPNAFVSDPPLEQVVSRTAELGLRGTTRGVRWRASAFQSVNRDDILFVSAGALTNEGFFENVGSTRRQGVELAASGSFGEAHRVDWFASYAWLDATFRESFTVASGANPAAIDDEIAVEPGDRIPGLPRHRAKLGFDVLLLPRWSAGLDFNYASSHPYRGDEGNLIEPVPGYGALNLRTRFELTDAVSMFAAVENLLDRDYESFGAFGEADDVLGDDYEDPRFLAPGAPLAAWVGVRVAL